MERKKEEEEETRKAEIEASEIEYVSYGGEHHLPLIMSLVDQELSEPYSIFTYRYFVYLWPQLSFLVPFAPTFLGFLSKPIIFHSNLFFFLLLYVCVWFSFCGFRLFTKGSVWGRQCVRWVSIGIRSEDTLLCWLSSSPIEAEALVIFLSLALMIFNLI